MIKRSFVVGLILFLSFSIVFAQQNSSEIIASNVDVEFKSIQEICSNHGENVEKAYIEAKKYFDSLSFSKKLKLWLALDWQTLYEKEKPFANVVFQLISDFFDDREELVPNNFLSILQVISDKQISSEQRIALMGWLLSHRTGYTDTSYMTEDFYEKAHDVFKK